MSLKKISMISLMFILVTANSFSLLLDLGTNLVRYEIAVRNMNANVLSKFENIISTMRDLEEMERQAKRWKYILENLDPSTMKGQLKDFYDFVDRYRTYTNRVAQTFNDITNFENTFYQTFKDASSVVGLDINEINKSRKKTKEMVQDSVHDSLKLTVDMTGSNNKDSGYVEQQEAWLDRVASGETDPKKIAQTLSEAVIQTNKVLLEVKAINVSMLTQLSLIEQDGVEDGKLNEEEVRQMIENNTKITKDYKVKSKNSGKIIY